MSYPCSICDRLDVHVHDLLGDAHATIAKLRAEIAERSNTVAELLAKNVHLVNENRGLREVLRVITTDPYNFDEVWYPAAVTVLGEDPR
jgi:regulator of replication initiation timing